MTDRVVVAHVALREATLVVLSIAGAILFLNHQVLYLDGSLPSTAGWTAYAASTLVIYAFGRAMLLLVGRDARPAVQGQCPQCGYPLGDAPPSRASPSGSVHRDHAIPAAPPAYSGGSVHPALSTELVNPPSPLADEVVDALLLRVLGTSYEPTVARPPPSEKGPPSPGNLG